MPGEWWNCCDGCPRIERHAYLCQRARFVNGDYYQSVSQAFDHAAQNYDDLYRTNRIMAWMREESLSALQASFPPGSRLLEIGCGSGEEAVALSLAGYHIVATDISPAMIETARAKAKTSGAGTVTWRVLSAGQVAELIEDEGPGAFDGAYASFGALNCEPRLEPVAAGLAQLIRPGGRLVCSVMGRWCGWEIAWGLLHLHPRQAFRRLGKGWIAAGLASPEGTLSVPVRYYSPQAFAQAYAPYFEVGTIRGLPVLLPPPYLDTLLDRYPALFAGLEKMEYRLRDRPLFRALGDHFLIIMERVQGAERP